jgi:hypothetical protein
MGGVGDSSLMDEDADDSELYDRVRFVILTL